MEDQLQAQHKQCQNGSTQTLHDEHTCSVVLTVDTGSCVGVAGAGMLVALTGHTHTKVLVAAHIGALEPRVAALEQSTTEIHNKALPATDTSTT